MPILSIPPPGILYICSTRVGYEKIPMGTTKVTMHADGYLQFNTNSAGGYPGGSNVKVATATNGVAPTTGTAAALAIALGG